MTGAKSAKISVIALAAHTQRGGSYSQVCATWSVTFPHLVLHIPLMLNAGQAFHLGSTGDEGSSTPSRLALRVMSLIAPACRKMPHIPLHVCVVICYGVRALLLSRAAASWAPASAAWVCSGSPPTATTSRFGFQGWRHHC